MDIPEDLIYQNREIIKYPQNAISAVKIPIEHKKFLVEIGLPADAAPFLSFICELDNGRLISASKRLRLSAEFISLLVIGVTGCGDLICIDESSDGQVFCFNHEDWTMQYMNRSIFDLVKCLIIYASFVQQVQAENGISAYVQGNIPNHLKSWLRNKIGEVDNSILSQESFWGSCLEYP